MLMSTHILKRQEPYEIYLYSVIFLGIVTFIWSATATVMTIERLPIFLFVAALAIVSQITTTSVSSDSGSVTYAIAPAISLAAIPFWGPAGAIVIDVASSIAIWVLKPAEKGVWTKSFKQLLFNGGMSAIAMLAAGFVYLGVEMMLYSMPTLARTIPWIIAAITLDQVNLWLLIVIIRLQQGVTFDIREMWLEDSWASRMSISVMGVGGGLLAYSLEGDDWVGVLAYFLPIFLSAYAFRLYVNQMQSHLDNLEEMVNDRTQELKNLMVEKDAFLAVLTHDMKTPLTSIGIYSGMLKDNPALLLKKPKIADAIMQGKNDLLDIVTNMLDLEKLSVDGEIELDREPFDLVSAIEQVVQTLSSMAEKKKITLRCQSCRDSTIINADRQKVIRIMQNLISNGVKYTGRQGAVMVNICDEDHAAIVEVSDTGYGIPEDALPHIFDRYHRVEAHKKRAVGTGLGLAIVKALVEAHDGVISVTSQEGIGSTFRVELPYE